MKITELFESKQEPDLIEMLSTFLPLAMDKLDISSLPKIKLVLHIHDEQQPTFGKYVNEEGIIYLGIEDRHPLDIIRTLAHELAHFKQGTEHQLDANSGDTGSNVENQAHEVAGIIMRKFDKEHPEYFNAPAVDIKEDAVKDLEKDLKNPYSYDAIDHMMTTISSRHKISPKKLHDLFVKKHKKTPDNWIKK